MGASVGAGPEDNSTGSETEKFRVTPLSSVGGWTRSEFPFDCDNALNLIVVWAGRGEASGMSIF
jgi:hypothetical protein